MRQLLHTICSRLRVGLLGTALLLAGISLVASKVVMASDTDTPKLTKVSLSVSEDPIQRDGRFITSFAPVVKQVAPSVVRIDITTHSKTVSEPGMAMPDNDLLRRFFGDQFGNQGGQGRTFRTPPEHGLGSGVIVTADGYIITNNHVVDDAETIHVVLNDGRDFTGKVVGRDPKTDVAVVKIDARNLPYVTLADSDKIEVGDLCLAIGNPFGVGQTVTMGMVSAKGRGLGAGADYQDYIQTDAAINPGNSGGALVDAEGRLIGINTMIFSRSGGNEGIGFAVPVNLARDVMESLVSNGKVVRGYLGVGIQDITPELAGQFQLSDDHGALVGEVVPHGPADKAGFQSGDVILDFNHKQVTDSRHLKFQVAETAPGSKVPVKIVRDGKEVTLNVTVRELPGANDVAKADNDDSSNDVLNGVTVADLNSAHGQANVPDNVKGAVVANVDESSAAYDAGLRPGDVIEEINHKSVQSADDAVKLTENANNKHTLLKIWSHGASHYLVVDESNKVG